MAHSIFIDGEEPVERPDTSVLCVAQDSFALNYSERFRGLHYGKVVVIETISGATHYARTAIPDVIVFPAQQRDEVADLTLQDVCRATSASFLPISLYGSYLQVGPLLGRGRSCALCWNIRKKQHDHDSAIGGSAPLLPQITVQFYKVIAALIAAAMTKPSLDRPHGMFSSPFWRLDLSHNQATWGTLTSSPACSSCTRDFNDFRRPTFELSKLIGSVHSNS